MAFSLLERSRLTTPTDLGKGKKITAFAMCARFVPDAFLLWLQISVKSLFVSIRRIVASEEECRAAVG